MAIRRVWVSGLAIVSACAALGCGGKRSSAPAPAPVNCDADPCGEHGSCADSPGTVVCSCDAGYAGAQCDACAEGYSSSNGQCLRDECSPGFCHGHGACSVVGGVSSCACSAGYQGVACDTCATGYQDNDHDGTCQWACTTASLTCGHGTCEDASGTPHCECALGYEGEACDRCAAGYQDHDGNGTCLAECSPGAPACVHGACDDQGGVAACECEAGYSGDDCAACADGYQDHDGDGLCLPDCATLGYTCSGKGACDDASGKGVCACASGYQDDGQGNCEAAVSAGTCAAPTQLALGAGVIAGTTVGAGADSSASCQSQTGPDFVYRFEVVDPVTVRFVVSGHSGFDPVAYVRSECAVASSELVCDDDGAGGLAAQLEASYAPGTYYLIVDGFSSSSHPSSGGAYSIETKVLCAAGTILDPQTGHCVADPCVPNPCSGPHAQACEPVLPSSYACHCDPGYIDDTGNPGTCIVNPNPTGESCADPIALLGAQGSASGVNAGAQSSAEGTCGGAGPETVFSFTLVEPMMATLALSGYDTVMHLRTECSDESSEAGCNDDASQVGGGSWLRKPLEPGQYFLFADSYDSSAGSFTVDYSFLSDPCASDPCPGTPQCVASSDWTGFECVCPQGTLPYAGDCVDDPCDPNPCLGGPAHHTLCQGELATGSTVCGCNVGFLPDTANPDGACLPDPNAAEWTFMVYMNGDNNLESFAFDDLAEMGQAGSTSAVQIVALLDTLSSNGGAARKLRVTAGGTEVLEDLGEIDMGDWRTLAEFGSWAATTFPARHYALVLWDHGDGWRKLERDRPFKGFSNDDTGSSFEEISVAKGEYAQALAAITATTGDKLDLVGFDACLMGMWEVADATAPYARVFAASEEVIPGDGWSYQGVVKPLVQTPSLTGAELAALVVQSYHDADSGNSTLASVDLETMPALNDAISAFADALIAHPNLFGSVNTVRGNTQTFEIDDYRDLWDFAARIKGMANAPAELVAAADALIAQLGTTILASEHQSGYAGAHGLSILLPSRQSSYDPEYDGAGAVWTQHTTWDDFLKAFLTQ